MDVKKQGENSLMMLQNKLPVKKNLHARNLHNENYNFDLLVNACKDLVQYIFVNKFGNKTIDFANSLAVKALNKALLKHYYEIDFWEIPTGFLCPAIPGRVDYLHYIADLISNSFEPDFLFNTTVKGLDIGTGANLVYPLLGNKIYGWKFCASEVNLEAIKNAQIILDRNHIGANQIEIRKQSDIKAIFRNVFLETDFFDFTICNPPFHSSAEEANNANFRKVSNLAKNKNVKPSLNFGGTKFELWCEGGERKFISTMISESVFYANQCRWFTTLVSQQSNLNSLVYKLKSVNARQVKIIEMSQGNKINRILAWSYCETKNSFI